MLKENKRTNMKLIPYRAIKIGTGILITMLAGISSLSAQTNEEIRAHIEREKQPLLDTLEGLVSIESGSANYEGVTRIGLLIAERLRELGGEVELVPPAVNISVATGTPEKLADT